MAATLSPPAPTRLPAIGAPAAAVSAEPAFYRPVTQDGQAFPLARSNFLSIIEFGDDWHAVRLRLIDGTWQPVGVHEGIDIMAERGTPIVSVASGVVENTGWLFYSGNRIGVRGDDGRYYFYAHLSSFAPGISPGATVAAGQYLGRVGNTGYGPPGRRDEFPPHLHFGIEQGDAWINPYPLLRRLYGSTVARDRASQARLDRLAAGGDPGAWGEAAAAVYVRYP